MKKAGQSARLLSLAPHVLGFSRFALETTQEGNEKGGPIGPPFVIRPSHGSDSQRFALETTSEKTSTAAAFNGHPRLLSPQSLVSVHRNHRQGRNGTQRINASSPRRSLRPLL